MSSKKIEIFGRSKGEEMAKAAGAPFLGQIPLDPQLVKLCDEGEIERYTSEAFDTLARAFTETLSTPSN